MKKYFRIHPGERFWRLTVMGRKIWDEFGNTLHLCRCECGTKKYFYGWQLRSGDSVSCGCYRRENIARINRLRPRRRKS